MPNLPSSLGEDGCQKNHARNNRSNQEAAGANYPFKEEAPDAAPGPARLS